VKEGVVGVRILLDWVSQKFTTLRTYHIPDFILSGEEAGLEVYSKLYS